MTLTDRVILRRLSAILLLVLCSAVIDTAASTSTPTDLDTRLERLAERLEEKRENYHVAGLTLVVVKDDTVVMNRGFGLADLEAGTPVTQDTLFAIGSTTKAFTATLVGMLVDEGKMEWDDPVVKHLDYFDPRVDCDEPDAHVTIRDALSHRSGFSRAGMLVAAKDVTPREVLEVANRAEPWDRFRENFHYSNVMYLAAGTASAEAAGTNWHRLLKKRILKPLGMKHTTSSIVKLKGNLANGYRWDEELEKSDPEPRFEIDAAAPAGAIVSNGRDMAQWIRFLLAGGIHDGRRLVAEQTLRETWSPQIAIADGVDYGMGWLLHEWKDRKFVEHGGNIHGFSTTVALMPEERLGFALLSNTTFSVLQQEVLSIVWETLLGEYEEPAAAGQAGASGPDLAEYVGDYIGNFGQWREEVFKVEDKAGVLTVDVPGQTAYELKPPNDDGRWVFALTDTIEISFERDDAEQVVLMRLHQAGFDFELPRAGVEIPPEIALDELHPYLGTYHSERRDRDVQVLIQNNRLAIDVPDQMVFELRPPDEEGRRSFRVRSDLVVLFEEDEDGVVASMEIHEGSELADTLLRSGGFDAEPLPTVAELIALRETDKRRAACGRSGAMRMTGKIRAVNAGLEGGVTQLLDGNHRLRTDADFGKFGWIRVVFDEETGEMETSFTGRDEIDGKILRLARQGHPAMLFCDWRDFFETIRVLKWADFEGSKTALVKMENPDTPPVTAYVDVTNGDIVKFEAFAPLPGGAGELPVINVVEDYREIEGLRIPFRIITENSETGRTVIEIVEVEFAVEIAADAFRFD